MGILKMSKRERRRLEVFSRVEAGELKLVKAAEILGISYRQAKRIAARYRSEGDAGLVHRTRGRASPRKLDEALREQVLETFSSKYADFGPTLAVEYLAKEDELYVSVSTFRRWLAEEGLLPRRRRRKAHRSRRDRKEHRGELLQMDGSVHDWFEGRGEECTLMVTVDDATGEAYARFFGSETLLAAMTTFRRYIEKHGVPHAIYVDRASIYRPEREATPDEILRGERPTTQFGRAMKELGVRLIMARSPQAKGRVERMNGTLQDRLIKAMRLAGISDMPSANAFMEEMFLPEFNAKFAKPPGEEADLHRPAPNVSELDLAFAIVEDRSVQNDWTVRWNNRFFQIDRSGSPRVAPRDRVKVVEQFDDRIRLFHGERELTFHAIATPPTAWPKKRKRRRSGPTGSKQGRRPAKDHPWRKPFFGKRKKRE